MTALGKVLVFFVALLALLWAGLTVNVFVTRTNWANDAKKWQEKAKEAEQSATYQRLLAEQYRDSGVARDAALRTQLVTLQAAVDRLNTESKQNIDKLNEKLAADQKGDPEAKLLESNVARLQKQVDLLQASLAIMERDLTDATVAREKSKGEALRSSLDKDAAIKARDDLELRLLAAMDQINEIRQGGRGTAAKLAPPEDFRATVIKVDGDTVEINLGANAKLQKGATLKVYRTEPKAMYLGTLIITHVDPHGAVGTYSPPTGERPSAANKPKAGDKVGVQ